MKEQKMENIENVTDIDEFVDINHNVFTSVFLIDKGIICGVMN